MTPAKLSDGTNGKEIIKFFEDLGVQNYWEWECNDKGTYYHADEDGYLGAYEKLKKGYELI
jgi:hypothetical protein